MEDTDALRRRVAALSDVGLEGPGAENAAAELDAIADEVEALLRDSRSTPGSGAA